ncbi:hypothetical protein MRX96_023388 [Rhipicephalus microplus]
METSLVVFDAHTTGEQQPESTANGGDETQTNAEVSAKDRGEVAAENIDTNVGYVQLEQLQNDHCMSIDHDRFHSVYSDNLINDAPSLRSVPPTVILTVLQDVEAVPFVKLLRECVNAPRVMTNHGTNEETFHTFMVTKVMAFGLADVPIYPTFSNASATSPE